MRRRRAGEAVMALPKCWEREGGVDMDVDVLPARLPRAEDDSQVFTRPEGSETSTCKFSGCVSLCTTSP